MAFRTEPDGRSGSSQLTGLLIVDYLTTLYGGTGTGRRSLIILLGDHDSALAKTTVCARPCLPVCLSRFLITLHNNNIRAHCWENMNGGHCCCLADVFAHDIASRTLPEFYCTPKSTLFRSNFSLHVDSTRNLPCSRIVLKWTLNKYTVRMWTSCMVGKAFSSVLVESLQRRDT
jgi:hypothetical protein